MPARIYVCFTCLRDINLLPLHYAALCQAAPQARVYYVFTPEEGAQAVPPPGSYRVIMDFPRRGNLLGLDCHLGMLETMRLLSEANQNACAVKIDSDVYLRSDHFLETLGTEHDMAGVAPAREYYCKGTCYGMTHSLIKKVIHYLTHGYIDRSGRLEDSTISMVAAIVSDANRVKIHNASNADRTQILYSIFHDGFRKEPTLLQRISGFIDCGDPSYTSHYADAPTAKADAMEFVHQHLSRSAY